jgi:hypothetical protein
MPTRTTGPRRPRRGPLRSPLAAAPHSSLPPSGLADVTGRAALQPAAPEPRSLTLAEFRDYLRTVNSRDGRPYEDATINAYVYPAKALDAWLAAQGVDGDFTTVDTGLLNRYFREYFQAHGQGGTHTQQRNLIQLFNFLRREYGHPSPYTDGLNRYAAIIMAIRFRQGIWGLITARARLSLFPVGYPVATPGAASPGPREGTGRAGRALMHCGGEGHGEYICCGSTARRGGGSSAAGSR